VERKIAERPSHDPISRISPVARSLMSAKMSARIWKCIQTRHEPQAASESGWVSCSLDLLPLQFPHTLNGGIIEVQ
jgi:hypothetical protein